MKIRLPFLMGLMAAALWCGVACSSNPAPTIPGDTAFSPEWQDAVPSRASFFARVRLHDIARDKTYGPIIRDFVQYFAKEAALSGSLFEPMQNASDLYLAADSPDDGLIALIGVRADTSLEQGLLGPNHSFRKQRYPRDVTEWIKDDEEHPISFFELPNRTWVAVRGSWRERARIVFSRPVLHTSVPAFPEALVAARISGDALRRYVPQFARTRPLGALGEGLTALTLTLPPEEGTIALAFHYATPGHAEQGARVVESVQAALGRHPETLRWMREAATKHEGRLLRVSLRVPLPTR